MKDICERDSVIGVLKLIPNLLYCSIKLIFAPIHDDVIRWNIFRVTGPLCGEFTGPGEFPAQRPVARSFDIFFNLRINGWVNNREAGDLRRHRGHYDVSVMFPPGQ